MVLLLLYFVNYIFIYFTVIRMWNVHLVEQSEQFKKAGNKLKTFAIQNIINYEYITALWLNWN